MQDYTSLSPGNGALSFGDGPNVQILSPAGRRAIQYMISGNLQRPLTARLYTLSIEQFLDRYTSSFRGVGPQEDKHVAVDDLPVVREWRQSAQRSRCTTSARPRIQV